MIGTSNGDGPDEERPAARTRPIYFCGGKPAILHRQGTDDLKDVVAQGETASVERVVSALHVDHLPQRLAGSAPAGTSKMGPLYA